MPQPLVVLIISLYVGVATLISLAATGTLNAKVHDLDVRLATPDPPFVFTGLNSSILYTNESCTDYPGLRFNNETAPLLANYSFVLWNNISGNSSLPVNITQYVLVSDLVNFGVNISALQIRLASVPGIQLNLTDTIGVLFIEDVYNGVPELEDIDPPPDAVFLILECTGLVYLRIGEEADPLQLVYFQYGDGFPLLYISPP